MFAQTAKPKVGIVLSGGVARGFAFLGALEVLVTNGVPIDHLVGTSAGALVTGLYASGYSFESVAEILNEMRLHQHEIIKMKSPPVDSVLDIRGFETVYQSLVGDIRLEDTSPPLAVTATELRPGAPAYIARGSLAQAVRASISLPIVFTPAEFDNKYYVDGGVRSPSPVGIAKELGSDVVIWLRPAPEERPTKPDSLFNNFFLTINAITGNEHPEQPDQSVPIKFADTLYFDFDRSQELIERGRIAGKAALPGILKLLQQKNIALNPTGDPHAGNGINAEWRNRFAIGLEQARVLPQALSIVPQIGVLPDYFEFGTRPASPSQGTSLGVQFEHGFLGPLSLQFGLHNPFANQPMQPYAGLRLRAIENLNDSLDFSFDYDPGRRPSVSPWVLASTYKQQESNNSTDNVWSARLAFEREALEAQLNWWPTQNLHFGLSNRFGHGLFDVGGWWKFEFVAGASWNAEPVVLRSRVLFGMVLPNTAGFGEQFSVGRSSLLRAYPNDFVAGQSLGMLNLELAYRWHYSNIAQLLSANEEVKIFFDASALNPRFDWSAQTSWLWNAGLGFSVDTKIFGFLPLSVGLDIGFAPNSWNIGFYTHPMLP